MYHTQNIYYMYTVPVPSDFLQQQSWVLCNNRYNSQQLEANFQAINGQKREKIAK